MRIHTLRGKGLALALVLGFVAPAVGLGADGELVYVTSGIRKFSGESTPSRDFGPIVLALAVDASLPEGVDGSVVCMLRAFDGDLANGLSKPRKGVKTTWTGRVVDNPGGNTLQVFERQKVKTDRDGLAIVEFGFGRNDHSTIVLMSSFRRKKVDFAVVSCTARPATTVTEQAAIAQLAFEPPPLVRPGDSGGTLWAQSETRIDPLFSELDLLQTLTLSVPVGELIRFADAGGSGVGWGTRLFFDEAFDGRWDADLLLLDSSGPLLNAPLDFGFDRRPFWDSDIPASFWSSSDERRSRRQIGSSVATVVEPVVNAYPPRPPSAPNPGEHGNYIIFQLACHCDRCEPRVPPESPISPVHLNAFASIPFFLGTDSPD